MEEITYLFNKSYPAQRASAAAGKPVEKLEYWYYNCEKERFGHGFCYNTPEDLAKCVARKNVEKTTYKTTPFTPAEIVMIRMTGKL